MSHKIATNAKLSLLAGLFVLVGLVPLLNVPWIRYAVPLGIPLRIELEDLGVDEWSLYGDSEVSPSLTLFGHRGPPALQQAGQLFFEIGKIGFVATNTNTGKELARSEYDIHDFATTISENNYHRDWQDVLVLKERMTLPKGATQLTAVLYADPPYGEGIEGKTPYPRIRFASADKNFWFATVRDSITR